MPAGLAFREGKQGTDFHDANPFIPHRIVQNPSESFQYEYKFKLNRAQYKLREKLYGPALSSSQIQSLYRTKILVVFEFNLDD